MSAESQTIVQLRPMLQSIALRIVGCVEDAEDIVQDTLLKWLTSENDDIENNKAYLIKSVTNNCLTHLKSLQKKKSECFEGLTVPDQMRFIQNWEDIRHDLEIEFNDVVNILYKKLEPIERAVFVMKEMFDVEYDDMAEILNKKKDNCRKILSRAKLKLTLKKNTVNIDLPKYKVDQIKFGCLLGYPSDFIRDIKQEISNRFK